MNGKIAMSALALVALGAADAAAQPTRPSSIEGRFQVSGSATTDTGDEPIEAELSFVRSEGVLRITRTGRWSGPRHPSGGRSFTWTAETATSSRFIDVVYRLPAPSTVGIAGALNGDASRARGDNLVRAHYVLAEDDRELTEELVNATRLPPEESWRASRARGLRVDSSRGTRLKLGGSLIVEHDRVDVVVPTEGRLTLTTSAGRIARLVRSDGSVAAVGTSGTLVHEIGRARRGAYAIELENARGGELRAVFVQEGHVEERARPWSTHTFYPVYDRDTGDEPNAEALFAAGGPLEKLDRALGLAGRESAVFWEKGTDYRSGIGFERGHYTRTIAPAEQTAEEDWKSDLDGDGHVGGGGAESFAALDRDRDGRVDLAEATTFYREATLERLFREYDSDGDGFVTAREISPAFVARSGRDGRLDRAAWKTAIERDYPSVLDAARTSALRLMARAKNGTLGPEDVPSGNAVDFMDDADVDGDGRTFFDRDNVRLVLADGSSSIGNRIESRGADVLLFRGRKQDELVTTVPATKVARIDRNVADGEIGATYGVGWWGHCNAWAIASILYPKPARPVVVNGETFSVRDQKGLLVELAMGATEESSFFWDDGGGAPTPEHTARYAARFHGQLQRWLRDERRGLVADMDLKAPGFEKSFQVWNYPLAGYVATLVEAPGDDPLVLEARVDVEEASYSDDDASSEKRLTYVLHFDRAGEVREDDASRTAWTTTALIDGADRVAFIRYLIHPFRVTGRGRSGNPNVTPERVSRIVGALEADAGLPTPSRRGR